MNMLKKERLTQIIIFVVSMLIVGFLLWYINYLNPHFYKTIWQLSARGDIMGLSEYIASFGYFSAIITIVLLAICNMTGLPTIPFLTVAGIIFGIIPGIIISWLGEFIGCILSFVFTRFFFRAHTEKLIEKNNMLTRLDSYSNMKSMLIARSIPYSPNILITALGAVSSLSFKAHFWATFIGKWPSVIIEVFLGHDLLNLAEHGLRFIFLVVLCIAGYFYMRWRKNSKNRK